MLWVEIGIVVVALVVLGVVASGVLGALQRLTRELRAADTALRPVRAEVQQTLVRAAAQRSDDPTATPR